MQGAARREYRAYCQGSQRGSVALCVLPKGDCHAARGSVAALANMLDITCGPRLATNRVAIAEATKQA